MVVAAGLALLVVSVPRAAAGPAVPPLSVLQADTSGRIPIAVGIPDVAAAIRCPDQRYTAKLPKGSAWAIVRPRPDNRCAIWLGGETGNPRYSGLPATYCELTTASRKLVITVGTGGPATAKHLDCTPTGFPQTK